MQEKLFTQSFSKKYFVLKEGKLNQPEMVVF